MRLGMRESKYNYFNVRAWKKTTTVSSIFCFLREVHVAKLGAQVATLKQGIRSSNTKHHCSVFASPFLCYILCDIVGQTLNLVYKWLVLCMFHQLYSGVILLRSNKNIFQWFWPHAWIEFAFQKRAILKAPLYLAKIEAAFTCIIQVLRACLSGPSPHPPRFIVGRNFKTNGNYKGSLAGRHNI